jgi:methylmalonyl-CoA/ethylmalonyl-CoA epimerase
MLKKIDHISFAVRNMEKVGKRLKEIYGAELLMSVTNERKKYRSDAYTVGGDMIIGLLEATSPDSFIAQHIEKYGESLQHIGIDVESLDDFMKLLNSLGGKYSDYEEIEGVRREVLVGPKSSFGAVLQVMEWLGEYKEAGPSERMKKAWDVD